MDYTTDKQLLKLTTGVAGQDAIKTLILSYMKQINEITPVKMGYHIQIVTIYDKITKKDKKSGYSIVYFEDVKIANAIQGLNFDGSKRQLIEETDNLKRKWTMDDFYREEQEFKYNDWWEINYQDELEIQRNQKITELGPIIPYPEYIFQNDDKIEFCRFEKESTLYELQKSHKIQFGELLSYEQIEQKYSHMIPNFDLYDRYQFMAIPMKLKVDNRFFLIINDGNAVKIKSTYGEDDHNKNHDFNKIKHSLKNNRNITVLEGDRADIAKKLKDMGYNDVTAGEMMVYIEPIYKKNILHGKCVYPSSGMPNWVNERKIRDKFSFLSGATYSERCNHPSNGFNSKNIVNKEYPKYTCYKNNSIYLEFSPQNNDACIVANLFKKMEFTEKNNKCQFKFEICFNEFYLLATNKK